MTSIGNLVKESLIHFWDQRQGREKQYLIASGVFAVFMLIYLIGIDPALTGREQLTATLPKLRQQVAEMQSMAQQLAALPVTDKHLPDISKEELESSLLRNGLNAGRKEANSHNQTSMLSVVDNVVRLQFFGVSLVAVQAWLIEMQKTRSLYPEEVKITRVDGGLVNAVLMLRQPTQNN